MLDISDFFINWEVVALRIGLEQQDVIAIRRDYFQEEQRRLGTLRKWKEKLGFRATYRKLIEALLANSQADLAGRVCKLLTSEKESDNNRTVDLDTESAVLPVTKEAQTSESIPSSERKRQRKDSQPELALDSRSVHPLRLRSTGSLPDEEELHLRTPSPKRKKSQSMSDVSDRDSESDEAQIRISNYVASGKQNVSILFIGKIGAGKSSMVNGIMGRKVAVEATSAKVVTSEITPYMYEEKFSIDEIEKEVTVKLWDTPGLGDPFLSKQAKDEFAEELASLVKNVDHVFYCLKMIQGGLEESDLEGLRKFSENAGSDIWKYTTFALTFANQVVPIAQPKTDSLRVEQDIVKQHFKTVMTSWINTLKNAMIEILKLPDEVVNDIPIVPIGYENTPPPDREEWFSPLWTTAFQRMKPEAQPSMFALSANRMTTDRNFEQARNPEDMNIYLNSQYPTYTMAGSGNIMVNTFTSIGAAMGAVIGVTSGLLGAAAGSVIGAAAGSLGGHTITRIGSILLRMSGFV